MLDKLMLGIIDRFYAMMLSMLNPTVGTMHDHRYIIIDLRNYGRIVHQGHAGFLVSTKPLSLKP